MFKLSLDSLLVLDTVDRLGTFAAAAEELFRVPSTISYTVSKLEQDLDVKIFERHGPKVKLTLAGRELLTEGRYLLNAAYEIEDRVKRVASGWETKLTIGMDTIFSPSCLFDEVRAFYEVAPKTQLSFLHDSLSGTWEALLDRRADLLIGAAGEGPSGGGYKTKMLGMMDFVFAVSREHPLAGIDKTLSKREIMNYRAVTVSDTVRKTPSRSVGVFGGQSTLSVPNMLAKLKFQKAGLGVGFLPLQLAKTDINNGLLIVKEVEETRAPEPIYVAWRTGEQGQGLEWWIKHLDCQSLFDRLWR